MCNAAGACVDKCSGVVCIATTTCIGGECVPICDNVRCLPGYECFAGKCQPISGYCSASHQCKSS